jgi:hypothetical protein
MIINLLLCCICNVYLLPKDLDGVVEIDGVGFGDEYDDTGLTVADRTLSVLVELTIGLEIVDLSRLNGLILGCEIADPLLPRLSPKPLEFL